MESKSKTGGERSVEIVAGPGHPVMAIVDVRVGVVPRPPQELDAQVVKWYIQQDYWQPDYKIFTSYLCEASYKQGTANYGVV